ncbi:MAG: DUF3885 domain-containing protein [Rhodanobacter sp.]
MNFRSAIESVFGAHAYARPLIYSYPHGLRFKLSEGDTSIGRFLVAIRKATRICADIFDDQEPVIVCLRMIGAPDRSSVRKSLAELRSADIKIPTLRSLWMATEPAHEDDMFSLNVAFEAPASMLQNFLWCALASDFAGIRPCPRCLVQLFNLKYRLMVLPYDDRGMDVVGPNHDLLAKLQVLHNQDLMDHDRDAMKATFAPQD